jgi:hypothetical protein
MKQVPVLMELSHKKVGPSPTDQFSVGNTALLWKYCILIGLKKNRATISPPPKNIYKGKRKKEK